MKIKDLFSKDIDRQINPAVVVSKQDKQTVDTEIEEYVFTTTITENLYKYLNTLTNSKQDKTGIWINGFYGSGKSHFIKYIYYCLNKEFRDQAFTHFIKEVSNGANSNDLSDATPSNIQLLQKKFDKAEIDTIIFNIDAVAGQKDDKEKITKIFFNQFNEFRGYNSVNITLAILLEKHLDKLNLFDSFKSKIKAELNEDWNEKGHLLISRKQLKVLSIAKELDPDLDIDALSAKLKNPDDITISDHLIPEFVEYLKTKDDNYRLVFLVDEISQYIGTNTNLLLNLQTIVEELGSKCGNKIWISTTAQQTIQDVVENTEYKGEDFGKILGRFETRISLESQNTTYITQKRILDKKSEAIGLLNDFYKENKEHIDNQFHFTHDLYRGFKDANDFVLSYPFIPYQFKLISDVFASFANLGYVIKEVKDNERSILSITHFTARDFKEREVGVFVTFDSFFNELMRNNITQPASRVLLPALSLFDSDDKFSIRIVHTLFMISNLSDTKKRTFPSNIDNIILLMLDNTDVNRLELQKKIEAVLDKLISQSIIYKEDDQYNFFKEDEIDIAKQIANQLINSEDRLTSFYEDIFVKIVKLNRKVTFGNNNFNLSLRVDDKEIYRSGDFDVTISVSDATEISVKALNIAKSEVVCCINEWYNKEGSLKREFEQFVKTKKFIRLNFDSATGTRKKAIEKFGDQNNKRIDVLKRRFESKFNDTPFISSQQVLSPNEINGSNPTSRFEDVIEKHLEELYKKNHLAKNYASSNEALKKSAADTQTSLDNSLTEAESQVDSYINTFGNAITADDVIKYFIKPPYGWKDISTLDVLVNLAKKNLRKFEWRNDQIDIQQFADKAIKTSERSTLSIKSVDIVDEGLIKETRKAYREIFNEDLLEDSDQRQLFEEMKVKLKKHLNHYQPLSDDYYGTVPFGKHFNDFLKILNKMIEIRDEKTLFEHIIKHQDASKTINDNCKDLEEFIQNQYSKYQSIRKFTLANISNFDELDVDQKSKANFLKDYFESDDTPGEKFPQINKIFQELSKALEDYLESLRKTALDEYEKIYKELDGKVKEFKVNEKGVYADKEYKLKIIRETKSIANLRLDISEASKFKSESLESIIKQHYKDADSNFKTTEVITDLSTVIENEEQLEEYISKLKSRLLAKLKEDKIIIIK